MSERVPAIKVLLLPKDTNALGTIFGGVILSHIDLASAVEARKTAPLRYVTKAMREVEFHAPVFLGDIVSFYTETLRVGRTSVTVKVLVEVERWSGGQGERIKVTEAEVVLVAVGPDGQPTPNRAAMITAFAPATVSNVGCGFDVLGFALDAPGDVVSAEPSDVRGVEIVAIEGDGGRFPRDPLRNTAGAATLALLDRLGRPAGIRLRNLQRATACERHRQQRRVAPWPRWWRPTSCWDAPRRSTFSWNARLRARSRAAGRRIPTTWRPRFTEASCSREPRTRPTSSGCPFPTVCRAPCCIRTSKSKRARRARCWARPSRLATPCVSGEMSARSSRGSFSTTSADRTGDRGSRGGTEAGASGPGLRRDKTAALAPRGARLQLVRLWSVRLRALRLAGARRACRAGDARCLYGRGRDAAPTSGSRPWHAGGTVGADRDRR